MRTKTLLVAAAISAAGLASSLAQSNVYSLNVVGYVNKAVPAGAFVFIGNPLNNGNNRLNTIMPSVSDNTIAFKWDPNLSGGSGDFDPTLATYVQSNGAWDTNLLINAGEGYFIYNGGGDFTNTFVGEVRQGALSTPLLGGYLVNMISSQPPIGGSINSVLAQMPAADNDIAMKWDPNASGGQGDFTELSTYVGTAPTGAWDTDLQFAVAEGILYIRAGANVDYVRNFTVQ